MASFSLLEPDEVAALASRWPITLRSARHIGGGLNNTSYLLDTDRGRWVMTIVDFPAGLPVATHAELLGYLRASRLPVTEPLPSKAGPYVVQHDDKAVMVKRYIEGTAASALDNDRLSELGELMARVGTVVLPPNIRQAKRRLPSGFESVVASWQDQDFAAWVIEHSRLLDRLLRADLDIGLVHGDLFPENTVIGSDGTLYLIDWETASVDMLILELGFAVIGNCTADQGLDLERVEVLLRGYESIRPLNDVERAHLVDATAYAATILGFWRYQNLHHLHHDGSTGRLYEEMVDLVAALGRHHDLGSL